MDQSERPMFHFTAPFGWINDPNGTVFYNGEYHLFYQHHPDSLQWGPMHWGHAVSADLLHWQHLPIALFPDQQGMIFSGSCVVDARNSSGFGKPGSPPMVAAYTSHGSQGERQCLAWSTDSGRNWCKYEENPVVAEPSRKDFRDPRVFYHEGTNKWVMVVASGDRARIYLSENLTAWQFASEIGPIKSFGGAVWECPDLFPLAFEERTVWVFSLSLTAGPNGETNKVMYVTGDFDGECFVAGGEPRQADWGRDFYAPITFGNMTGRTVWIAWMNCWEYAGATPAQGWRGMMTLPRALSLSRDAGGIVMRQQPVQEFLSLPRRTLASLPAATLTPGSPLDYRIDCSCFEVAGKFARTTGKVALQINGSVTLFVDFTTSLAGLQRIKQGNSCKHAAFCSVTAPAPLGDVSCLDFHVYVDGSAVEVFLLEGKITFSALIYPVREEKTVSLSAEREPCLLNDFSIDEVGCINHPEPS